ncbi:MAG: hypothetical protein IJX67_10890 [Oscillospiraceae bacterium]|nr:hypothetical protein [Oscillospiraceae bacterium]
MGEHKHNPTAIAAKNGELPPKKKPMSKREQDAWLRQVIADKTGLTDIRKAMEREAGNG